METGSCSVIVPASAASAAVSSTTTTIVAVSSSSLYSTSTSSSSATSARVLITLSDAEWIAEYRQINHLLAPFKRRQILNCLGIDVTDEIIQIFDDLSKFWMSVHIYFAPEQVLHNLLQPINLVLSNDILSNNFVLYVVAVANFTSKWTKFYHYRNLFSVAEKIICQYNNFKNVLLDYNNEPMSGFEFVISTSIFSAPEILHLDLENSVTIQNLHNVYNFSTFEEIIPLHKQMQCEFVYNHQLLTNKNSTRYNIYPIIYKDIWDLYHRQRSYYWTSEDVDTSKEHRDLLRLNTSERKYIKYVLTLFVMSNRLSELKLNENFVKRLKLPEANTFLTMYLAIKKIHMETQSLLMFEYVASADEQKYLYKNIEIIPIIKSKNKWVVKYLQNMGDSLGGHIIVCIIFESIFGCSTMGALDCWLDRNGFMPGLFYANKLILRDITLYCEFASLIHNKYIKQTITTELIYKMLQSAVDLEIEFATLTLPISLIGIENYVIIDFIKYKADNILKQLKRPKLYHASNPFK